jgi:hypothetical protein
MPSKAKAADVFYKLTKICFVIVVPMAVSFCIRIAMISLGVDAALSCGHRKFGFATCANEVLDYVLNAPLFFFFEAFLAVVGTLTLPLGRDDFSVVIHRWPLFALMYLVLAVPVLGLFVFPVLYFRRRAGREAK